MQFGLPYGISNNSGQTPAKEVTKILDLARKYGIDTLDTASTYGESEVVLGQQNMEGFKVISKFSLDRGLSITGALTTTLQRLGQPSIYGFLAHNARALLNAPELWEELEELRHSGKVERIGYSLYSPDELENLLALEMYPDLIQVPFNLLDRRFKPYFAELAGNGVEIHTRSAFLQGLFFMQKEQLSSFFDPVKSFLVQLAERFPTTQEKAGYLLQFCLKTQDISKVVIGVNNVFQLKQNIFSLEKQYAEFSGLPNIFDIPESILIPYNWPKS